MRTQLARTFVLAIVLAGAGAPLLAQTPGDPARGSTIYHGKGACATCHQLNGVGSRLGPDLSEIGNSRRPDHLERSLVEPNAEVLGNNRFYHVVTKDGATITGRLLNLDTFTIQLLDSKERLRTFVKGDLRDHGFDKSPMPSYKDKLTAQELADLVSYLASLKGQATP